MDPQAAIDAFWDAYTAALEMAEGTPERAAELSRASEHAAGLFEWIAHGGFPPQVRWAH